MKKFSILLISSIVIFSLAASAGAATISVTPTGTYLMAPGESVSFDVLFTADSDGDTLTGATLSMGYDAAELDFISYATPLGWDEMFGPMGDTGSVLYNYNQNYPWTGGPLDVGANESVSIGTFTFEATAGLVEDTLSDLWVVDDVEVGGLTYSSIISYNDSFGEYASTMLTAQGADVAPVPVPAAVWLLGSGLIGLVGLRRKQD
jgi:hypothetical protein